MTKVRHHRPQIWAEREDFTLELDPDLLFAVTVFDSEASADSIDQRVKRDRLTEGDATALVPRGLVTDTLTELVQEAGFPDTGFTDDEHHLSVSGSGFLEAVRENREFPVAAEQRCQPSLGLDVETAQRGLSGEHLPRSDGLGLALHSVRAEELRIEEAFYQVVDGFGNDDLTRLGDVEKARCDVRRVADRSVVHAQVASDAAHDDQPGVETLAYPELNAAVAFKLGAVRIERPPNAEGSLDRAPGVILVSDRSPE
jgi:hypothetical protein